VAGAAVIAGSPWGVWLLGLLGLTATLAAIEFAALFVRLGGRAAAGEDVPE